MPAKPPQPASFGGFFKGSLFGTLILNKTRSIYLRTPPHFAIIGSGGGLAKRIIWLLPLLLIKAARAHCPLCTAGAAVAAGGAAYMGVNTAVIGLFIGAFAVSTGWWVSRLIKKQYIPYQKAAIILLSFLLTVIPLMPIIENIYPLFISIAGEYGSLLNRTYVINLSWVTSIIGGMAVSVAPWLSRKVSGLREGKVYPFQGVMLTLMLLAIMGGIIQVVL